MALVIYDYCYGFDSFPVAVVDTYKEAAEFLGITEKSAKWYATLTCRENRGKRRYIVPVLELCEKK